MDFEVTYTPEQEAFRGEVQAWLADNIPEGLTQPIDPGELSLEQYEKLRELGRRLGDPPPESLGSGTSAAASREGGRGSC